jgi:hypothetical protein
MPVVLSRSLDVDILTTPNEYHSVTATTRRIVDDDDDDDDVDDDDDDEVDRIRRIEDRTDGHGCILDFTLPPPLDIDDGEERRLNRLLLPGNGRCVAVVLVVVVAAAAACFL